MLEIGKVYEYEYMHQVLGRPRDSVRFQVMDYDCGFYTILFDNVATSTAIESGSPMAELAEEVEHVPAQNER